jgi:hypothetical protein
MTDNKSAAQAGTAPVSRTGRRFVDMHGSEKMKWLGKVVVMVCTGGFVFPNIWVE